jgi:lactate permease
MPLFYKLLPLENNILPPASRILFDWLLSFLPILAILVLMLGLRWRGMQAGGVGWLIALLVAVVRFGTGWELLANAQLKGLILTLSVTYILWGALLFFRVTDEAGAVTAVGAGLPRLTPDRGMQALLLGWVFSTFLQGVGGFGVPVAVVAPLLVGLGFPPLAAIVIPSVGHPWAVTFGSQGSSFFTLMEVTGRDVGELAPWSAVMLGLACLACGAGTLWAAGGWRTLRANWVTVLVIGLTMAGTQYLVVTQGLWSLGATLAGLAGLVVGVSWARWRAGRRITVESAELSIPPSPARPLPGGGGERLRLEQPCAGMPIGRALLPYALLVVIVLVAQIPAVGDFLGQVAPGHQFPEFITPQGNVLPAKKLSVSIFGHAGALLTYASVVAYLWFHWKGNYTPGATRRSAACRIVQGAAKRVLRSGLATATMLGMAVTMEHAGMTHLLASGIARVAGRAFPFVAPFIGALGAFMTGSNTNSNAVFANLQQNVAVLIGVSPLIILAAQTAGGAIGSAFAPAKIVVGCSTVEAEEGPALKAVMRYGLTIVVGLAVATTAVIYLF